MGNENDDKVAVTMITQAKGYFFVTNGSVLLASAALPDHISRAISLPPSSSKATANHYLDQVECPRSPIALPPFTFGGCNFQNRLLMLPPPLNATWGSRCSGTVNACEHS